MLDKSLRIDKDKINLMGVPLVDDIKDHQNYDGKPIYYLWLVLGVVSSIIFLSAMDVCSCLPVVESSGINIALMFHHSY